MRFAEEYVARGWRSCFYDIFSCIHIGKKTWEKTGTNAYTLNNTEQFILNNNQIVVYVLSQDIDKWKDFKIIAKDQQLDSYRRSIINKVTSLSEKEKDIYLGNEWNYCRNILNEYSCQYFNMWKNQEDDLIVITREEVGLCKSFGQKFSTMIRRGQNITYDLVILAYEQEYDNISEFAQITQTRGPITSYMLSRIGRQKLIKYLETNQIKSHDLYKLFNQSGLIIYEYLGLFLSGKVTRPKPEYKELEGYKFYSQLDSCGGDICNIPNKNVEEMKQMADQDNTCVGFNTLGWFKKSVTEDYKSMIYLPYSDKETQGLYVKIAHAKI